MSMLQLDRRASARYITDPKGMELLFDGAPREREPSGAMETIGGNLNAAVLCADGTAVISCRLLIPPPP
jgi:hypothetical protein